MRKWIGITAALALAIASPLAAHAMDRIAMSKNQPVILGEVISMNVHSVTVRTPAGESMPLEVDSRTMMAANLPAETRVRCEFKVLDNGIYLAQRITPIERGSTDWETLDQQLAMAQNDMNESNESAPANYANDVREDRDEAARNASMEAKEDHDVDNADHDSNLVSSAANDEDQDQMSTAEPTTHDTDNDQKLPATASPLPLAFVTGLLLLVGAGCLWLVRRRAS